MLPKANGNFAHRLDIYLELEIGNCFKCEPSEPRCSSYYLMNIGEHAHGALSEIVVHEQRYEKTITNEKGVSLRRDIVWLKIDISALKICFSRALAMGLKRCERKTWHTTI